MKKILLMSALLMTSYFASAQILLRVKLAKGLKYIQKREYNDSLRLHPSANKRIIESYNEVTESGKQYTIKSTNKRIYFRCIEPTITLEYDSDISSAEQPYRILQLIKHYESQESTYSYTFDDRKCKVKADGLSSFKFPEKAVNIGDTWTATSERALDQEDVQPGDEFVLYTCHTTYTLSKIEKGIAYIDIKSVYNDKLKKVIGTQSGAYKVLVSNGLLLYYFTKDDLNKGFIHKKQTVMITNTIVK